MPTVTLPITTYSIYENRPAYPVGSPSRLTLRTSAGFTHKILMRLALAKIPAGAVITDAKLQFWTNAAHAGSTAIRVYPITSSWKSAVTWDLRPTLGTLIDTTTIADPPVNTLYEFDVTTWAATRDPMGLALDTTSATTPPVYLYGSNAATHKPVMVVDYYLPNSPPSNLMPRGGAVSVPSPILSYQGDEDMAQQQIQYSSDGTVPGITYDTGLIAATTGRYVPSGGAPVLTAGQGTYWRVRTSGGGGTSDFTAWVAYTYEPIDLPVITNPPATTDDGSPVLTWTSVPDQVSWQADLRVGPRLIATSGWDEDAVTRDWVPPKSIRTGVTGRLTIRVRDSVPNRVAAEGAPIFGIDSTTFTVVAPTAGVEISGMAVTLDDPIPVITGTRALGTPDMVALVRDGVVVPIWDADGIPHMWAPALDFFSGTTFSIRDYTADLRQPHTWTIWTKVGGVATTAGVSVTETLFTRSAWMVDPRTGDQIEILGENNVPVVSQQTVEGSVLHTPVHGDLIVEPVRRRLMRTTQTGSVEGMVLDEHADTLEDWALSDSGLKYRLIFGTVNWSVIFGDYSPAGVFYSEQCSEERTLISFNWWERLADY